MSIIEKVKRARVKFHDMELDPDDYPVLPILEPRLAERAVREGLIEGVHFYRMQTIPA